MDDAHDDELATGARALAGCRWDEAAAVFEGVLGRDGEHAEALDGLGRARYWQQRYREAFALRERAFAIHRRDGNHRSAAMIAVRLAMWHGLVRGNGAAVSGWLAQATRCIGEDTRCREAGWVELFRACVSDDPDERERLASRAVETARDVGDPDLEFDALAYVGTSHVERGRVAEGLRLVDEAVAAVSGGVVSDPWAAGEIYCVLLSSCELAVDLPRAEQWLGAVSRYVERTGEVPIEAIGKIHYGGALTLAGRFDEAERELREALAIYDRTYVGTRGVPAARLAEVLARTGQVEEAGRLLDGLEDAAVAARPRACVLAAAGEREAALAVLERALSPDRDRMQDLPTLVLAAEIAIELGRLDHAEQLTSHVDDLAAVSGSAAIGGLARMLEGRLAIACGSDDDVVLLERALTGLTAAGLSHAAARTRLLLARVLAGSRPTLAREEARTALAQLRRLGADRESDEAAAMLRRLGEPARSRLVRGGSAGLRELTPRQREVLELVAEGLSNAAIADRLVLSERTVEHHVGNVLRTLDVSNRTEAAAALRHAP